MDLFDGMDPKKKLLEDGEIDYTSPEDEEYINNDYTDDSDLSLPPVVNPPEQSPEDQTTDLDTLNSNNAPKGNIDNTLKTYQDLVNDSIVNRPSFDSTKIKNPYDTAETKQLLEEYRNLADRYSQGDEYSDSAEKWTGIASTLAAMAGNKELAADQRSKNENLRNTRIGRMDKYTDLLKEMNRLKSGGQEYENELYKFKAEFDRKGYLTPAQMQQYELFKNKAEASQANRDYNRKFQEQKYNEGKELKNEIKKLNEEKFNEQKIKDSQLTSKEKEDSETLITPLKQIDTIIGSLDKGIDTAGATELFRNKFTKGLYNPETNVLASQISQYSTAIKKYISGLTVSDKEKTELEKDLVPTMYDDPETVRSKLSVAKDSLKQKLDMHNDSLTSNRRVIPKSLLYGESQAPSEQSFTPAQEKAIQDAMEKNKGASREDIIKAINSRKK